MIFGRASRTPNEPEVVEDAPDEADAAPVDADPRHDGPFDLSEVSLDADDVHRLAFGPLIVTPFDGLQIQLHGDPETATIQALLAGYEESGLELALFAAPRSGGMAEEIRESIVEESAQAGGNAQEADGPFGTELRRVLPVEGPEGEQLFHVSRVWVVEGPRWVLRGTLMGRAALVEGEEEPADVFAEFFRNLVVSRDETPRVPGELIHLAIPENSAVQG